MRYTTSPWPHIVTFYAEFTYRNPAFQPMHHLVREIAASPYAFGLFPLTSMVDLRIGHYPDYAMYDQEVVVTYDYRVQHMQFRYYSGSVQPTWIQMYPHQHAYAAFERFITRYARWFSYA